MMTTLRTTPRSATAARRAQRTPLFGRYLVPLALPLGTRVAVACRDDMLARIASRQRDDGQVAEYTVGQEAAGRGWVDYVQGVTAQLRAAGHAIGGFTMVIAGNEVGDVIARFGSHDEPDNPVLIQAIEKALARN